MYTHDHNQQNELPITDCECQENVYQAINEFISNNEPPYLGEGMCIAICQQCYASKGEHLKIRPRLSSTNTNPASEVAFTITADKFAKDYLGGYELRISFHSQDEEDFDE